MRSLTPESPLRRKVRRLLARETGLATGEVPGYTNRQVARVVQHLLDDGAAFRARLTGKEVRYFDDELTATAWLEARRLAEAQTVSAKKEDERAPWSDSEPPFFPVDADGKPAWKMTVCPGPNLNPYRTNTHTSELH